MEDTPEYLTLIFMRQKMKDIFQDNLDDLAKFFHTEGLIDDICKEVVTQSQSFLTNSEKADEIIKKLTITVQLSQSDFHKIIEILQLNGHQYRQLIEQLKEEYVKQGTFQ